MRTVLMALTAAILCAAAYSQDADYRGYSAAEWAAFVEADRDGARLALRFADDDANDLLMALLDNPSPSVRRRALGFLASSSGGRHEHPLSMSRVASYLEDPDPQMRACAARVLAGSGVLRSLFLEDLLANLDEEDEDARYALTHALGRMGESGARALWNSLGDPGATVRACAATALGECRATPELAVRALLAATGDTDADVRVAVARALEHLHSEPAASVPVLARMLRDESAVVRAAAAHALARFRVDAKSAVRALIKALSDPDEQVRVEAAEALRWLGEHAVQYHSELFAAMMDRNPEVRSRVVGILGESEHPTDATVLAIGRSLNESDPCVRSAAAEALYHFGTRARLAIPDAVRSLSAEYPRDDRYLRGFFLQQVARSIRAMLAAVGDPDENVRYAGLRGLELMGRVPVPKELGQVLRSDRSADNRAVAARILKKSGDRAFKAIPELVAALSDPDRVVRISAARALIAVGNRAVPALEELRSTGTEQIRERAESIILSIRTAEDAADPAPSRTSEAEESVLPELLSDSSSLVREQAAHALAGLGVGDARTIEALRAALKDDNPAVRADAALALGKVTWTVEATLAALKAQLGDPDADARWHAVRALRKMGDGTEGVRGALLSVRDDPDEIVRIAVRSALERGESDR